MDLKAFIREIPDFLTKGILFKDITPLVKSPEAFHQTIDAFEDAVRGIDFDTIVGIEARGFLFAAPLALKLGRPLVPVRKEGKLPSDTHSVPYSLEYGSSTLEVHTDAIHPGQRALIVDDLLATGGTLEATASLVEACGGEVAALAVVIELTDLGGRARIAPHKVLSLVEY